MKESPQCTCGNIMTKEVSTFTHVIFKKEITIHDVPHYQCTQCGNSEYDSEETVIRLLRETYLKQEEQTYYH